MRTSIILPDDWREPIGRTFGRGELVRLCRDAVRRRLEQAGHTGLSKPARPGSPVQDSTLARLVLRQHVTLDELSAAVGVDRDSLSEMLRGQVSVPPSLESALESIRKGLLDS